MLEGEETDISAPTSVMITFWPAPGGHDPVWPQRKWRSSHRSSRRHDPPVAPGLGLGAHVRVSTARLAKILVNCS